MNTTHVIFDMDGVIIDSEPFWMKAESEVFTAAGFPLIIREAYQSSGLRVKDLVAKHQERFLYNEQTANELVLRKFLKKQLRKSETRVSPKKVCMSP
jgi:sugar-phosphatase